MNKKNKTVFYFLFMTLLLLTSQSCKSKKEVTSFTSQNQTVQKSESIGGTWVLNTFDGKKSKDIFPRRTPTISITEETNKIEGNGGCNGVFGTYSYKDGVFSAPNMASTMMFCEDAPLESQLLKMLGEESMVKVSDGVLTFSQKGKTVAEFTHGIDSQILLGEWFLKKINGKDIISSKGNDPTIVFNSESNISGFAGCNRYSSTLEIDGYMVKFGPILTTRMACQDMQMETSFINALSQSNSITVNKDTLSLSSNGQIILTFKKL